MSAVCGRVQAPLNTAFPVKTMCYGHVLLCSSTPASTAHCAHIYIYICICMAGPRVWTCPNAILGRAAGLAVPSPVRRVIRRGTLAASCGWTCDVVQLTLDDVPHAVARLIKAVGQQSLRRIAHRAGQAGRRPGAAGAAEARAATSSGPRRALAGCGPHCRDSRKGGRHHASPAGRCRCRQGRSDITREAVPSGSW